MRQPPTYRPKIDRQKLGFSVRATLVVNRPAVGVRTTVLTGYDAENVPIWNLAGAAANSTAAKLERDGIPVVKIQSKTIKPRIGRPQCPANTARI